jgi:hypothetical protein
MRQPRRSALGRARAFLWWMVADSVDREGGWDVTFEDLVGVRVTVGIREVDEAVDKFEVRGSYRTERQTVFGTDPERAIPVTSELLRHIPFRDMTAEARRRPVVTFDSELDDDGEPLILSVRFEREQAPRPGRRGHPERWYAEIAVLYEQWLGCGKPLRLLADELHLSEPGLRTALRKARDRGLLTEAPRKTSGAPGGVAGGRATEKAKRLLKGR